jgi:hypothetical protein
VTAATLPRPAQCARTHHGAAPALPLQLLRRRLRRRLQLGLKAGSRRPLAPITR